MPGAVAGAVEVAGDWRDLVTWAYYDRLREKDIEAAYGVGVALASVVAMSSLRKMWVMICLLLWVANDAGFPHSRE